MDLVYSTAFRVLRNASLAEEVTQRAFQALAQNSQKLSHRSVLTGWLHETARNFAIATVRSEERRRLREQEAAAMRSLPSNDIGFDTLWNHIEPHLDEALARLSEGDRDALLLRYFERKTAREIGERLGLTEEAAQKRAARALDRLRAILAERGLAPPTAGLASLLSIQAVQSAPLGLTAAVIGVAEAVGPSPSTIALIMASTKVKIGLAAVLAAGIATPLVIQHQTNTRLLGEIAALRQQGAELSRLRDEVQRRTAEAQSLAQQRENERMELARLRGELAAAKTPETRTASAVKRSQAAKPRAQEDASEAAKGGLVQRDEWRNVGFQAPSLTVKTLEWAKANGDTNVIANALAWADVKSRAGVEAIFAAAPESVRAKYGSADEYVLSLFNHSGPLDDRHTLLSYRILEANVGEDEAILQLEYHYADGSTPTAPQRYVRIGNEWRQALDFDGPAQSKLSTGLQAEGENLSAQPSATQ